MIENSFNRNILPDNEADRLQALERYKITDTPSEKSFDSICRLAAKTFGVPISLLSIVDAESVFFKSNIGMGTKKKAYRGDSLCALAILDDQVTVFEDALKEPCLLTNPNVVGDFGLRFYAGAPLITHDGYLIGSLCIIDKQKRTFSQKDRMILEGFAEIAMDQIELRRSSIETIEKLAGAQINIKNAVNELAAVNSKLELKNEELKTVNNKLQKSFDLTKTLNSDLEISEQRLKSFISKAPIAFGILKGENMIIELANDMILKIWGKTSSVIGVPLVEAMPELKDQPYPKLLENVYKSGETFIGDTAYVKMESDGVMRDCYFDFVYEPLKDHQNKTFAIIVIANEVTERISNKLELEELNRQFEIALHAGQLGSYNLNIKTGEMTCSEICKSNYGRLANEKFDFADLIECIEPEFKDMVAEKVSESIANKTQYNAEYLIKWPDGSLHWMSASGLPGCDAEGNVTNMIGVTVDITKRKNYEVQKDDFLSIASHELKTPITSLKATVQLLSKLKSKPEHPIIPKLIDQAHKSTDKLSTLVDDLLNMHRISEGKLKLEESHFDLATMIENCCNEVGMTGNHYFKIISDGVATAYGDEQKLEQVVLNFINNAIKYAPQSDEIVISIECETDNFKISVTDQGEGIDPAIQPKLFDRYFRASHDGRKYSGLGLGLYISSEIVTRHGGEIGVISKVGEGSTFWFSIPAKKELL